jgi:hypothetical protein
MISNLVYLFLPWRRPRFDLWMQLTTHCWHQSCIPWMGQDTPHQSSPIHVRQTQWEWKLSWIFILSHMQNKTNTNSEAALFLAFWTGVRHLYTETRNTVKRLSNTPSLHTELLLISQRYATAARTALNNATDDKNTVTVNSLLQLTKLATCPVLLLSWNTVACFLLAVYVWLAP